MVPRPYHSTFHCSLRLLSPMAASRVHFLGYIPTGQGPLPSRPPRGTRGESLLFLRLFEHLPRAGRTAAARRTRLGPIRAQASI